MILATFLGTCVCFTHEKGAGGPCVKNFVQPGTRGLVLHAESITCGQEDATDVVVESYLKLVMSSSN